MEYIKIVNVKFIFTTFTSAMDMCYIIHLEPLSLGVLHLQILQLQILHMLKYRKYV